MRKIYTLIFVMIALISCQAQKEDLGLKLEVGKQYKQITISNVTINEDINGQKFDMGMTVKGSMSYLVKSVNENVYDMEVKYESLSMSMQLPQGNVEFSSEKNDVNDLFSSILAAMVNKSFELQMSKNGKVIEVKNIETIWESAISQFDQLPEAQREQVKDQIMKAYGAKALKGNIEMVTAIFPDKSVRKGEKWTINTSLESGMSAKMITEYEFSELNSDYVLIIGNSTIETADKDAYVESNGMPMKYDLTGTMISEIKIDKITGWIIEAKINQELKGDAYIKENPQMLNGMKIPMIMKNEMTITNN
jgi:hypothetical protein